jgi:spermidine/putrescine transport system permease protein
MAATLAKQRTHRPIPWVKAVLWAYFAFILVYHFLPSLLVSLMSFNAKTTAAFPIESLTLRWWPAMFKNAVIWAAVKNSVVVAVSSTLLTSILSILAAYALVRYRLMLKTVLLYMLVGAMVIPYLVVGIALLSFWAWLGVERGLHTVTLAHVALALPYATLTVAACLQGFDVSLEEAAQMLGAGRWLTFRRITLPLLTPGVIAGAALAFTISMDEFNVTYFIIGVKNNTLPIMIYSSLRFGISPELNAISTLILFMSMLVAGLALGRALK